MVDPLSYFSFQPWYVRSCHIKEPLLLIGKSSPCGGSGFSFSLSEWSSTICLTPYNRKENVLSVSLNKTSNYAGTSSVMTICSAKIVYKIWGPEHSWSTV